MKKLSIGIVSAILSIGLSTAYALNEKEIEYHCPSIKDIKYDRGIFSSETSINGVEISWFALDVYPENSVSVKQFDFTNSMNDCSGGTCQIYCVYKVESKNATLKMFVSRQEYRFVKEMSGPWKDRICSSEKPESCTFSVIKNHW